MWSARRRGRSTPARPTDHENSFLALTECSALLRGEGAGLGCVRRKAEKEVPLVLGDDRRQRGEVRAPAP